MSSPPDDPTTLGKRSIFYEPQWNPLGKAPKGFKNVPYPLKNPKDYPSDPTTEKIPIPEGPPPKYYKRKITAIEAPEERRDLYKETLQFVPRTIASTQKPKTP
ncbi:BA75_00492T0 [Komagataella pastoris]|uniref:BA75_00492T0 n=1 Tax=Komagataella pastoris TaxID=4922 RepID=A0A1B2J7C6_PICPA|nr:BA75_00492T0 [Komagataella pastoris]